MTILAYPKRSLAYKGLLINEYSFKKGEGLPKHDHPVNHLTMCVAGSCLITKENVRVVLTPKDQAVDLAANEWHEIEALEDNTIIINIQ